MGFRTSVAVDLGTVNTLIWVAGKGVVLEEPSAIAVNTSNGRFTAIGNAADVLHEKEPRGIDVIHPLRDGVIADLDAAIAMLHGFLRRAVSGVRPARILVAVPGGATFVERQSVLAAISAKRARYQADLIDEPVAAAAGGGIDLAAGAGGFVVDVGGGTTEIAAVAGWQVVRARSLRVAGNAMDEAIVRHARDELGLILSLRAARQLKTTLGLTGGVDGWAEAIGIDAASRAPRVERVSGDLVADALGPLVERIGVSVRELVSDIPPGLAEEVVRGKVRLSGGGALLAGLAERVESAAGLGVVMTEDPLRCVVRGAALLLETGQATRPRRPLPAAACLTPRSHARWSGGSGIPERRQQTVPYGAGGRVQEAFPPRQEQRVDRRFSRRDQFAHRPVG
jgi:rod shape-determining protein MreB